MEHQTLGRWVFHPSNPATQRIILKIVRFVQKLKSSQYLTVPTHILQWYRNRRAYVAQMLFHQVWWNCFYFELKTVKKFLKVMAMEAWVSVFLAFPVPQEASFPTFLLKTFHFQKLVLESESRYIVGCFICSTFNCISVFLSHLKYTGSPPLTLFFETLTKPYFIICFIVHFSSHQC